MKKVKKLMTIAVGGVMVVSMGAVSFADSFATPAQIYSDITGKTVQQAQQDRQTGKTYGQLAKDEGKYEQFKEINQENKKQLIEQRVKDGTMTREQADAMLDRMENCDGTGMGSGGFGFGREARGDKEGAGMRRGLQDGQGNGSKLGNGQGRGQGQRLGQLQEK